MLQRSKTALLIAFPSLVISGEDYALNAGGMMEEGVIDGLGALDNEGAFCVSSPLVSEEFSNARRLGARQRGDN